MARVIISFLGTGGYSDKDNKSRGKYRTANYSFNTEKKPTIYESEFVSEALYKHYNADRIIYIGTLKSMWEVVYDNSGFNSIAKDEEWENLAELVESSNHKTPMSNEIIINDAFANTIISPIVVKYGLNDEENEYNIRKLFSIEELLDANDELYIDISHGFRSLPIVLTNVLTFFIENSKKKISIANISYGMFEVSGEMNGVTPIVNLNIINELQQNIKASHEFNEYGNAFLFSKLLEKTNKSMSKLLMDFSYSKGLNHLYDLKSKIQQLKSFKYSGLSKIQEVTIPIIVKDFLDRFEKTKTDSQFQFEIGKWMFENKQYGSTSIAIIESLITKVCELESIDSTVKENRDCAKMLITIAGSNKKNAEKRIEKVKLKKCQKSILMHYKNYEAFHEIWGETNVIRKSVSHSISTSLSVTKMVKDIEKYLLAVEKLVY